MKKMIALAALLANGSLAFAGGYIGASVGKSNLGVTCAANESCAQRGQAYDFRAGVNLASKWVLDFGFGSIDAVEVGFRRTGRAQATGRISELFYPGSGGSTQTRVVPAEVEVSADAVYLTPVARFPIDDTFEVTGKLGLAYVATRIDYRVNGATNSGQTENNLAPLIGFGLNLKLDTNIKVVLDFDLSRIKIGSESGSVRSVLLGMNVGF